MTPAVDFLKKHDVPFRLHDYDSDPTATSYGDEAAQKMGVPADRVFKTLIVSLVDESLAVGVVPVSAMLNLKSIAKVLGAKKAVMAEPTRVERVTGYVLGGVSPVGQKKLLPTIIDERAGSFDTIFVSGGRRGLEIEIAPGDLCAVLNARFAKIS